MRRYIENEKVGDDIQLFYNPDLLSEDKLEEYANDYMYYNDGVFPYVPKNIWYLDLAVGYQKDRDTMSVVVEDISFEPSKDKEGNTLRMDYNEKGRLVNDVDGDFTIWQIVFHLGEILEKDLKKDR